jgi:hypothetical protein
MQLNLSFETTVAGMKLQFKNKKNGWVVFIIVLVFCSINHNKMKCYWEQTEVNYIHTMNGTYANT